MTELVDKRVLLVEDEAIVAMMVEDMLASFGVIVVGPVYGVPDAIGLAQDAELDAAVLDVNIHGGKSFPVAEILQRRGVPFIFATGYNEADLSEFVEALFLKKPYTQMNLQRALSAVLCPLQSR